MTSGKLKGKRGRTKDGKTCVSVAFTAEELKAIDALAVRDCRSRCGQITYMVLCAVGLR